MHRAVREEGLPRRHRFTVQGSFGPILRSPLKWRGERVVVHVAAGQPGVSRIGTALTRRHAPSSLLRNRLKRVVRELFRRHALKRAGLDVVVSLRQRVSFADAPALRAEIGQLLDRACAGSNR
jgi:ribonuclease P protein component